MKIGVTLAVSVTPEYGYLVGEKSVGLRKVDSTFPTSPPSASDVARSDFQAGSLRKSSHDFLAASRLLCAIISCATSCLLRRVATRDPLLNQLGIITYGRRRCRLVKSSFAALIRTTR